MIRFRLLLLIIYTGFSACQRVADEQTLERQNYFGNELKIHGYYYSFERKSTGDSLGTIFFLYRNGAFLYLGSPDGSKISDLDKYVLQHNTTTGIPGDRESWGTFQIENSKISIERWLSSSGRRIPAQIFQGNIINDTTINLKLFSTLEIWKYRNFSGKPDSTNIYVK
jgi:hypothetical protein